MNGIFFSCCLRVLMMVTLSVFTVGCGGDSAEHVTDSLDRKYRYLTLNHEAVTLAVGTPYDTVQLIATPRAADGSALSTTETPVFTASQSNVTISASGLVTAVSPITGLRVIASLRVGHLTLTDTVIVNVNQDVTPIPVVGGLSIQPDPGDSAKTAVNQYAAVNAKITDVNGVPIDNVAIAYRSSDTTVASVDEGGNIMTKNRGRVMLFAYATVYGVTKTDSLLFTVGAPIYAIQRIYSRTGKSGLESYFSPQTLTVGVGAVVLWINNSEEPVDVVFDNPSLARALPEELVTLFSLGLSYPRESLAGSGNIPTFVPADSTEGTSGKGIQARWFPMAGTGTYHSVLHGTTGSIVVTQD